MWRRAYLGAVCRLRDERRNRRCHEFVLEVGGRAHARESLSSALPDNLEESGPEGDAVRAGIGKKAYELNVGQFCCGGLNFEYFYQDSPIIAPDTEAAPGYTLYDFKQSTVPGCRTPHPWLRDGRSLYDVLGPGSHCCV